jgi:hypothetical protein
VDLRRQRRFATALTAAFGRAGIELVLRTQRELVAGVSIEQALGQPPVVSPDRPLLWLTPTDGQTPGSSRSAGDRSSDRRDERFVGAETFASARSIATLTRSPVLNRPSPIGLCGTLPAGSALAARRVRRIDEQARVRAERFTSSRLEGAADQAALEVHDYGTAIATYGFEEAAVGPFRSRVAVESGRLVKVRVVGDRTPAAPEIDPETLAASRRIAAANQLDLATVSWLIDVAGGTRAPARIDCWHWDFGLGRDLEAVAEAIAAWTQDRLGAGRVLRLEQMIAAQR